MRLTRIILLIVVLSASGCASTEGYRAFRKSHDLIQNEMTFKEVFQSSLADYLMDMKVKNVPGVTLIEKRPVSDVCKNYISEISYAEVIDEPGIYSIRIYCNEILPSSQQIIPEQLFNSKSDLLEALDTTYRPWMRSMRFRVESPPTSVGGGYDYYEFTIDHNGRVSSVSGITGQ